MLFFCVNEIIKESSGVSFFHNIFTSLSSTRVRIVRSAITIKSQEAVRWKKFVLFDNVEAKETVKNRLEDAESVKPSALVTHAKSTWTVIV